MIEGVELFIGGSVTAAASSWVTALLSSPMLALSEITIRALTGGISSLIFILLAHLLHLIFTRGEGDDHSVDNEKIGSGTSAIGRGGTTASASGGGQGGCCQGCSVAYCNAIQQKKNRKKAAEDEFSILPQDEHYFNFKDSSLEQKNIVKPPDCAFGFCQEISPASSAVVAEDIAIVEAANTVHF